MTTFKLAEFTILLVTLFSLSLAGQTRADFNGDGVNDLAIGVPFEGINGAAAAGAVNVVYGGANGLNTAKGNQFWHQGNLPGTPQTNDKFGSALAVGDFDGDTFDDLAIGVPGENASAGVVHVLYGTAAGLATGRTDLWSQDQLQGEPEAGDRFGYALASGDFNGDGKQDLAIGAPGENGNRGVVHIIYGGPSGLKLNGNQLWGQDSAGILDFAEAGDFFGASLAAGNFGGNFRTDLAIGVPLEDVFLNGIVDAGAVHVLYGSAEGNGTTHGLNAVGNQFWTQSSALNDPAEAGDQFGFALAAGNFGRPSFLNLAYDDLAIGVPYEDVGSKVDAGGVNVIYGSFGGLTIDNNQFWTQDSPGILEVAQAGDWFGFSLAAANFGHSSEADLAIGVPGEDVGLFPIVSNAGAVNVLYGKNLEGLTSDNTQLLTQAPGSPQSGDGFGTALSASNFGNSYHADLAVGVPGEDLGWVANAGSVNVFYGRSTGFATTGVAATKNQVWNQNNLSDTREPGDQFGRALHQTF